MSDDRAEQRRRNRADEKAQRAKETEEKEIERDWEIDPAWKSYVTHVRGELIPQIVDSAMSVSIVPADPTKTDVKYAIETGLSILLDKPIILCVPHNGVIPVKLRLVADHIIVGDPADPAVREQLMAAIEDVGKKLDEADG